MTVKSLKKQLMAAIAMVIVAAIALSSATYAWFVNNNEVEATTSTISAKSNSAFMYIRYDGNDNTDLIADVATLDPAALYPAHWGIDGDDDVYEEGKFYTAFAAEASAADRVDDTVTLIGEDGSATGTPAEAVAGEYAVLNKFHVGAKGNALKDLTIADGGIELTEVDGKDNNEELDNALRVLIVCGENWILCDKSSVLGSNCEEILAEDVTVDAEVDLDMYVFYDGDDAAIYTNNLAELVKYSKAITITFSATPDVQ